jgi:uncharacterized protein
MYCKGQEVPQDYVEAYMWLKLAASRSSGDLRQKSVDLRDFIAWTMTTQEIAEAQRRLAREWKPKTE